MQSWRVLHGVSEGAPGVTVDKFGGALVVQSWREPPTRDDVFDLCDAAFGGQLGFDDVHSVWVHPRAPARDSNRDWTRANGANEGGEEREASRSATAGVYRRASFRSDDGFATDLSLGPDVYGRDLSNPELGFVFSELNLAYGFVPPRRFGDPSLYLDFRPTRRWIASRVAALRKKKDAPEGVSVLNAFAYTCGAGLVATASGASRVLNTDHSATYLAYGAENYRLNGFEAPSEPPTDPSRRAEAEGAEAERRGFAERGDETKTSVGAFAAYCEDFYPAVRQLAGLPMPGRQGRGGGRGARGRGGARGRRGGRFRGGRETVSKKAKPPRPETFDLVILDPPTLTKTAYGAVDIENDYQSLAKPCGLCVTPGGVLLATNHSHRVDLDDWLEIVERCVEKAGCSVTRVEVVAPDPDDDDHPAMSDGKRPLKVAAFTLE